MVRGSNRYTLSYGGHSWSGRGTVTSVSGNDLVLSGLTANAYNGMRITLLFDNSAGGKDGGIYNVVSNTTTNITLQEGTADWGASDVFAVEVRNATPTTRNLFLDVVEDFEFPTPTAEIEEYPTLSTGQDRHALVVKRYTFNTSLPTIVKDFRLPFFLFGKEISQGVTASGGSTYLKTTSTVAGESVINVNAATSLTADTTPGDGLGDWITIDYNGNYPETRRIRVIAGTLLTLSAPLLFPHTAGTGLLVEEVKAPGVSGAYFTHYVFPAERTMTGTDMPSGGGSTLNGATAVGATSVILASAASYAAGDYIQIGVANPEIRQITNVATNTLTLDSPLRFLHATGVACNEVYGDLVATPWSTTVTEYAEESAFDLVGVYTDTPTLVRDALFTKINSGEFSSDAGDLLKFTADLICSDVVTTGTAPTVGATTTSPYQYRHVSGGININGQGYLNIEQFRYSLARNDTPYYTHQTTTGSKPFWLCEGRRTHEIGMTLIPANNNIYNLLDGSTKFAADLTFTRATYDTLSFYFRDVMLSSDPHGMVIDGPVRVSTAMHPAYLLFAKVVDQIPFYPGGDVV